MNEVYLVKSLTTGHIFAALSDSKSAFSYINVLTQTGIKEEFIIIPAPFLTINSEEETLLKRSVF